MCVFVSVWSGRGDIRAVGVLGGVGVQVVVPVRAGPLDGVALDGQRTAVGRHVLEPLGHHKGLVRNQAVVAEGDADAARDEVQAHRQPEVAPAEGCGGEEEARVQRGTGMREGNLFALDGVQSPPVTNQMAMTKNVYLCFL